MESLDLDEMVDRVAKTLRHPKERTPAFTLILGSGFSWPVLPTARDMVLEDIPWWLYFREKDCAFDFCTLAEAVSARSIDRADVQRFSREVWKAIYDKVSKKRDQRFELTGDGDVDTSTHLNVSRAYTAVMSGVSTQGLYDMTRRRDFLYDVIRRVQRKVNRAHIALAGILEHQNDNPRQRPFCRTIFTTNFDPLLQRSLQLVNVLYHVSDRTEQLPEPVGAETSDTIHLMYAHGSVFRNWVINTDKEIKGVRERYAASIRAYLDHKNIIVMGYSGWSDALMQALTERTGPDTLYWCDRVSVDDAPRTLRTEVLELLEKPETYYVPIPGADEAMSTLHLAITKREFPRFVTSPIELMISGLQSIVIPQTVVTPGREERQEEWSTRIGFALTRLQTALDEWNRDTTAAAVAEAASVALVEQSKDNPTGAIPQWTYVIEHSTSEADRKNALMNRAVAYRERGAYEPALADYATLLGMKLSDEENARVLSNRATALTYAGRWEEAIEACSELLALPAVPARTLARALGNRGWARYRTGDLHGAVGDATTALAYDPSLTPVRFNLGLALLVTGNIELAKDEYETAAAEAPDAAFIEHFGIQDLEQANVTDPAGNEILTMLRDRQKKL